MIRRASAMVLSSGAAVLVAWMLDLARCVVAGCAQDDPGVVASELVGPIILIGYVVLSWLTVYPTALALQRYVSSASASARSAVGSALVVAGLLHRPGTDGSILRTLAMLGPWLGISWFVGAFVAVT